ncbi:ABC transporter permease [Planotetraspora sp. A-T 1434]|uniref:ABC transporter permease n=1 Tax=Planotetraspora sp. A-T 1434 TaxID=2979219 RepID=UPI0021C0264D|nr:ABC transporter permease [Planotetraspora sp. A-T 1434]MCT9934176.1 ABC transporter permease [Planotetraspora sp. A-T 1434]
MTDQPTTRQTLAPEPNGKTPHDPGPPESPADAKANRTRRNRRYIIKTLSTSPTFISGAVIVLFWVFVGVAWQLVVPHDPQAVDPFHSFEPPSSTHLLGTDNLGRDVLSRVLAGAQTVLLIAPAATVLAVIFGALLGLVAGYYGGIVDIFVMRAVDVLMAIPTLIVAVLVLGILGSSLLNVIILIAVFFVPQIARTVRGSVGDEVQKGYVEAARMRGERGFYSMVIEVLPNVTSPILVEATIRLGYAVFTAATLSFLGLGLQPPSPDWGRTISEQRAYIEISPWALLAPAIALATFIVGVNLAADGLRKAFK